MIFLNSEWTSSGPANIVLLFNILQVSTFSTFSGIKSYPGASTGEKWHLFSITINKVVDNTGCDLIIGKIWNWEKLKLVYVILSGTV